jgi:hypothetical protein
MGKVPMSFIPAPPSTDRVNGEYIRTKWIRDRPYGETIKFIGGFQSAAPLLPTNPMFRLAIFPWGNS